MCSCLLAKLHDCLAKIEVDLHGILCRKSNTDQYDKEAMRYLSIALLPCVGGYAIYALLYETHKSWYSWIINSLVGAVYAFGFILMCPQVCTEV